MLGFFKASHVSHWFGKNICQYPSTHGSEQSVARYCPTPSGQFWPDVPPPLPLRSFWISQELRCIAQWKMWGGNTKHLPGDEFKAWRQSPSVAVFSPCSFCNAAMHTAQCTLHTAHCTLNILQRGKLAQVLPRMRWDAPLKGAEEAMKHLRSSSESKFGWFICVLYCVLHLCDTFVCYNCVLHCSPKDQMRCSSRCSNGQWGNEAWSIYAPRRVIWATMVIIASPQHLRILFPFAAEIVKRLQLLEGFQLFPNIIIMIHVCLK